MPVPASTRPGGADADADERASAVADEHDDERLEIAQRGLPVATRRSREAPRLHLAAQVDDHPAHAVPVHVHADEVARVVGHAP